MMRHRALRHRGCAIAGVLIALCGCDRSPIEVPPPAPAVVDVTPDSLSFSSIGDSATLVAVVKDKSGQVIPGAAVRWSSSSPSVASVDSSGLVIAKGNGVAHVTARSGSVTGTVVVRLTQVIATLSVTPADLYFTYLGETAPLNATARDARGSLVPSVMPVWSLSNPTVASVSPAGQVVAIRNGWTLAIGTYEGHADTALVHVTQVPAGIRITPGSATIDPGESVPVTVRYIDRARQVMDSGPQPPLLQINSLNNAIASVTTDNRVLAYAPGRTIVRVRAGVWFQDMIVTVTGLTIPRDTLRTLGGFINADRIVQAADSGPVRVTSEVFIPAGVRLTLGPGVTLLFEGAFGITVNGTLVARGTAADSIRFVSNRSAKAPGDWAGIVFGTTATDWVRDSGNNYAGGSSIAYAVVTHGGGIWIRSPADILVEHSRIARNRPVRAGAPIGALGIEGGSCSAGVGDSTVFITSCTVIRDNVIEDNATTGVDVTAFALIQRNLIRGNVYTFVNLFRGGGMSLRQSKALVMDNRIIGNTSGYLGGGIQFEEGAPMIIHNEIRGNVLTGPPHNGAGIGKNFFTSAATIEDNVIEGNSCTTAAECSAIFVTDGFTGTFYRNNVANQLAEFEVYVNFGTGAVDMRFNYWGTATSAEIERRIYDQRDLANRALVNYDSFSTTPLTGAGPRP